MHKVSTDVNNVRNDGPELIAPLSETATDSTEQLVLGEFEAGQLPFDQLSLDQALDQV
jgi:hypothetical protein